MKLTVYFDDYDMTEFLEVTALDRGIFQAQKARTEDRTNKIGNSFLGTKSAMLEITMGFALVGDVLNKRRKLAAIINCGEPKKLIFSDEPNKFYLAYPAVTFDDNKNYGTGTITWQVPDGVAHSTTELTFTNLSSGNTPQNYLTISNPGSKAMPLSLEATFQSDNGFLGLQNKDGTINVLFGDVQEADGEEYQRSERLLETTDFADWEDWTSSAQDPGKKATLTMGTKKDTSGTMLGTLKGTMGKEGTAQVAVKRKLLPADSNGHLGAANFYAWARAWFETGKMGQTGTTSINFVATDGSLIASYNIEKVDKSGNTARVCFITGEAPKAAKKTITFTPAYWKSANPWTNKQEGGGGPWDFKKEGAKLTFYWWGSYFPFVVPALAEKELGWVEYVVGQWNGRGLNTQVVGGLVSEMNLRYISVTKMNVDAYKDDPNKFSEGDVLAYTQQGQNFVATLNNINALGLRDPGSTAIVAPPGDSIVYVACSDFGSVPLVKLVGRPEYL